MARLRDRQKRGSNKLEIKDYLVNTFYLSIGKLEGDTLIEAMKHKRELTYYIINTLNLNIDTVTAVHGLSPKLFNMLNLEFEQILYKYEANPHSDETVKTAFAFKMLIGE